MMRVIGRTVNAFRFADIPPRNNKGIGQHLKAKRSDPILSPSSFSPEELSNSHRLLYIQFAPAAMMALPALYSINDPTALLFINSLDLLQYYLSGVLCFNSFFAQSIPLLTQPVHANSTSSWGWQRVSTVLLDPMA